MPTVPYIDQTAQSAPQYSAPGVAPMRNAAPEQMQELGKTLQQAGSVAMSTGATISERLNDQVDDATVKKAETDSLAQVQTILHDPDSGYLNQRGQNAIDQYKPAQDAAVKAFQGNLDALSNPIQKHIFQQAMNQHLLSIGQQMSNHDFIQKTEFATEAAVSRANAFATSASNASSSYGQVDVDGNATGDFAKNLAVAEQETLKAVYTSKGAPPDSDVAKEALLNVHTQIGMGLLSQMMDARSPYSKVQSVYDDMRAKGFLTIRAQDTLGKMVKQYSEQEMTRTAVNQNLSDAYRASMGQPTTSTGTPDYQFPVKGATVTSSPYADGAVAVTVAKGSSIQAPAAGTVKQVGRDAEDNFTMKIEHADGSVTTFSGLNAANVKAGDKVQGGEDVATSGGNDGAVLWSLADKNGNKVDPTKAGLAPVDLTQIVDEKVLNAALVGVRKQITDPVVQQQATVEMESFVRHNQQKANAMATQIFKQASDQFYAGGMNWRAIQPSTFNQLTPEQRQQFKDKQTERVFQLYDQSQKFKTMSETDVVSDFYANPEQLTVANVDQARDKLSNSTYLQLMNRAQEQSRNPQGVIEASAVQARVKLFAQAAGIKVDPKTPEDKNALNALNVAVSNAIDQIKAQNKGKATDAQVDEAIKQQLIQRSFSLPSGKMSKLMRGYEVPYGTAGTMVGSDNKRHYVNSQGVDLGEVPEQ